MERLKQVYQEGDQRLIGWRHGIIAHLERTYPFQDLTLTRLGNTLEAATDEERHQEMEALIGVAGEGKRSEALDLGLDADLFAKLADQRFLGRLASLHLAARKLPQTCKCLAFWPLGQENPAVGINQCAGYNQQDRLGRRSFGHGEP